MKLKPVKSSQISHIGHDPDTKTMVVQFHGGQRYAYQNVTAEKHAALVGAGSIGTHFHQHIRINKKAHPYSKYDGSAEIEGE